MFRNGVGKAGNILLTTGTLSLISTATASGRGGNININLGDILLLRGGSQINTSAGTAQAGGDGDLLQLIHPSSLLYPKKTAT